MNPSLIFVMFKLSKSIGRLKIKVRNAKYKSLVVNEIVVRAVATGLEIF